MILERAFTGLSVMTVADLIQLPLVREKLIISQFLAKDSIKHSLGLQLWHLFQYGEKTEVIRQNDKQFIDKINKVRVDNIDDNVKNYSR